jgi:hypothetical protein
MTTGAPPIQSRVLAFDGISQTAEALQWSSKYCAELQARINAASRALGITVRGSPLKANRADAADTNFPLQSGSKKSGTTDRSLQL